MRNQQDFRVLMNLVVFETSLSDDIGNNLSQSRAESTRANSDMSVSKYSVSAQFKLIADDSVFVN